jgi:hypothetical protein
MMKFMTKGSLAAWLSAFALCIGLALAGSNDSSANGLPRFCQGSEAKDVRPVVSNQGGVALAVSKKRVETGAFVYARLVNFGGKAAGYGQEFRIERYSATGWALDPSSPDGPWVKSLGKLPAGAAGRCYRFRVPVEQAKGRYRFSTKVFLRHGSSARRTSEFLVE